MGAGGGFYPKLQELSKGVVLRRQYAGKTLGVDASMFLHQHMFRHYRAYIEDGDTWQVAELVKRDVARAASMGIRLFFVFDGKPCPNKAAEDARRSARKAEAMRQWRETKDPDFLMRACGRT